MGQKWDQFWQNWNIFGTFGRWRRLLHFLKAISRSQSRPNVQGVPLVNTLENQKNGFLVSFGTLEFHDVGSGWVKTVPLLYPYYSRKLPRRTLCFSWCISVPRKKNWAQCVSMEQFHVPRGYAVLFSCRSRNGIYFISWWRTGHLELFGAISTQF